VRAGGAEEEEAEEERVVLTIPGGDAGDEDNYSLCLAPPEQIASRLG